MRNSSHLVRRRTTLESNTRKDKLGLAQPASAKMLLRRVSRCKFASTALRTKLWDYNRAEIFHDSSLLKTLHKSTQRLKWSLRKKTRKYETQFGLITFTAAEFERGYRICKIAGMSIHFTKLRLNAVSLMITSS